jgi:hypothetical protein
MIKDGFHLTYCTNIHPGESWEETFKNLQQYVPDIKKQLAIENAFGIGLRLSHKASLELIKEEKLQEFKSWLQRHDSYVFTLNGFPYGGFHRQVVKDQVHHPDWTTSERRDYTFRLFDILDALLPEGMDGGISTSPLSYKFWHNNDQAITEATKKSVIHLSEIAAKLYEVRQKSGKILHLDLEPEPDGLLENTQDVLVFFRDWLLPIGKDILTEQLNLTGEEAEKCLKEHIRVCYDICHFAVVYEKPTDVFAAFRAEGIKVGKIQISAALKLDVPTESQQRRELGALLLPFAESTYLHQVVAWEGEGKLEAYRDLSLALNSLAKTRAKEWRIHFHVPVFLETFSQLASTQSDILEVLNFIQKEKTTNHLEVETYTWEVLPEDIHLDLTHSIIRELQWVIENMDQ